MTLGLGESSLLSWTAATSASGTEGELGTGLCVGEVEGGLLDFATDPLESTTGTDLDDFFVIEPLFSNRG